MNAFELLKNDHQKVSGIFQQLEPTTEDDAARRQTLVTQLKQDLDMHAHIEETIFYPALKKEVETREITLEALDEHQEIKDLLAQLVATPPNSGDWSDALSELKESVEHHVDEEENEMFSKARDVLSPQQIEELGTRMQNEKQQKTKTATG